MQGPQDSFKTFIGVRSGRQKLSLTSLKKSMPKVYSGLNFLKTCSKLVSMVWPGLTVFNNFFDLIK